MSLSFCLCFFRVVFSGIFLCLCPFAYVFFVLFFREYFYVFCPFAYVFFVLFFRGYFYVFCPFVYVFFVLFLQGYFYVLFLCHQLRDLKMIKKKRRLFYLVGVGSSDHQSFATKLVNTFLEYRLVSLLVYYVDETVVLAHASVPIEYHLGIADVAKLGKVPFQLRGRYSPRQTADEQLVDCLADVISGHDNEFFVIIMFFSLFNRHDECPASESCDLASTRECLFRNLRRVRRVERECKIVPTC